MTHKRKEYICWDSYFLGLAALASFRSKDPSTQNGACIVDPSSLSPLSIGYNGFPRGCSDDEFPWGRESKVKSETKYPYVEHAERNAIFNAARNGISLNGSYMYLYSEKGYYPCEECTRAIIQSGIIKLIMAFEVNNSHEHYDWNISKKMFNAARVNVFVMSRDMLREKMIFDFRLISEKMSQVAGNIKNDKGEKL